MYILLIEKRELILSILLLIFFTIAIDQYGVARGHKGILYLKNGTIYRSRFIESIYGSGYRIWTDRNNYMSFAEDQVYAWGSYHRHALPEYQFDYKYDTASKTYIQLPTYFYPDHGFFFEWQTSVGSIDGMRIVMGYRFNTYIGLGFGFGAEYRLSVPDQLYPIASGYAPFFVYLTGDLLKKKLTPFYSFEAGYLLPMYKYLSDPNNDGAITGPLSSYTNYGGLMTGIGFGIRIHTRRRYNASISLNMNAGFVRIKTNAFEGFSATSPYAPNFALSTSNHTSIQPLSLRFSLGF